MTETLPEPVLRRTPGGWLATTRGDNYPRIGVIGETREAAREQYVRSRAQWLALRELPPE